MEILLNRWRGTGIIFTSIPLLTGTLIYSLYLNILVGYLSNYYYGFLVAILFLIGESFGWGKWVGYLCQNNQPKNYYDLEGYNFPYIHYIANFFIKEKEDYLNYCRLALNIRGFIWWTPILILLGFIDLLSWYQVAINSIILAVGFPIGCELSKFWNFEYKSNFISIVGNWEKQEIIYGFIQFICITFSIFLFAIIK